MTQTPPRLTALTAYLMSRTGKQARSRVAAALAGDGLRMWHMALLAALDDAGPLTQRELAARLDIDPSDVTKALEDLDQDRGWIDRRRDPADRRRVVVAITAAGAGALAALTDRVERIEDDLLAALSAAERRTLHALLRRVFTNQL
jgi:MarR family transcriptional regulator, lower aerobic nicotinate degradation pathway regulator